MKITPENIVQHELIGLLAKIVESRDPTLLGFEGKIVDETQKTLLLLSENGKTKRVPKAICVFHITLPDGIIVKVDGKLLIGRPQDRVKKIPRKKW